MKNKLETQKLFQKTDEALKNGSWIEARKLLDDLGQRNDNCLMLKSAREYSLGTSKLLHKVFEKLLQDRIDQVNMKAGLNEKAS